MRRNGHSSALCAGFGLTEAMIAVGIVATALLVLVQQLSIGFRESGANEDRAFAYQKASAILSEIQNAIALGQIERGDQLLALADEGRNFTLTTRMDHEGLPFVPGHPMSGNVTLGNEWRWSRTVSVEPHDHAGLYYCRVQIGLRDGERWQDAASHALLFSLLPPSDAPEQTHDVYVIACAEAGSQLGDLAALRDSVRSAASDLAASSQANVRLHWITRLGYGRDASYAPFVNVTRPADAAAPWAYWMPGQLGGAHAGKSLYRADLIAGVLRTEDGLLHATSSLTAQPVAIADRFNHCMRTPAAWSLFESRVAAGLEEEHEPPLQLLLDDLQRRPERYRNAVFLNLHGRALPLPPLRNASDAAKDPVGRPGVRVVTHPARLWTPRDPDGNGNQSDTKDLELRVHAYRASTAADVLQEPILVQIFGGNFTGNVNGKGTGQPTLLVHRLQGGVSLDTGLASGDGRDYAAFDSATGVAPNTATKPFEMWFETGYVGGADPYTWLRLHNTPLTAPQVGTQGLHPDAKLYGLEHCPSPVRGEFEHDLATTSTPLIARNTARWRIRMPASAFAAGSLPARDHVVRVVTRIGADATTGVRWPTAKQPQNRSETFAWWTSAAANVPAPERAQFLGDPRLCPYTDLMATGTTLANGYNACFDDLVNGSVDARAMWPCLQSSFLAEGFGGGVRADAGRLLQLWRDGMQKAGTVFVAPGDRMADALLLGGEIAMPTQSATEPVALHADFSGGAMPSVDTITRATNGAGGAVGELALARGGSSPWRCVPFLGELCPDDLGDEWLQNGNIAFGTGASQLAWTPLTGTSFADAPRGTGSAGAHSSTLGAAGAAMLACCGPASSTLTFATAIENAMTPSSNGAVAINHSVQSEPPLSLRSARTIRTPGNSGVTVHGLDSTASYPRSTLTELDVTWNLGAERAGAAFTWSRAAQGSATLALWTAIAHEQSSRDLAHQSLLLGLRALHTAGKPKLAARVPQLPRLTITDPVAGALAADPLSMTVRWSTEWLRYDGDAYTEAHDAPSDGDESDLVYRVLWSRDQGLTWRSAITGNTAVRSERPSDEDDRLVDGGEGGESFTFALPDDLQDTELVLAVEAWRASTHCHFSSHQTRVFVRRSRR